jgi:hypothetical protein
MATTITNCPSCNLQVRVPEELFGRMVRCPSCRTQFVGPIEGADAPAPPEKPPPGPAPAPFPNLSLDDEPAPSTAVQSEPVLRQPQSPEKSTDLRPCPACGERIPAAAKRCRFCDEKVVETRDEEPEEDDEDERPWERRYHPRVRRDCEPHRGNLILVFGIISLVMLALCAPLGLPFGILAWVMGNHDLQKMRAGIMDPDGMGATQAGKVCGIVGTIIDGLYFLGCMAYFGFLIFMAANHP